MSVDPARIAAMMETGHRDEAARALDAALIEMHGSGETRLLCDLHQLAARYWAADEAQVGFHITHAWVYALEGGFVTDERALSARLRAAGRAE